MSHIIVAFSKRENAANIRNILMRSDLVWTYLQSA